MKLHLNQNLNQNRFTAYSETSVSINKQEHTPPLLVSAERLETWEVADFAALQASDFEALLAWEPEVVLLGTGTGQKFPHPRLMAALLAAGVGVEVMTTQAACRTFNILADEDRRVVAALF